MREVDGEEETAYAKRVCGWEAGQPGWEGQTMMRMGFMLVTWQLVPGERLCVPSSGHLLLPAACAVGTDSIRLNTRPFLT